ncbi:MAG: hypothetical protein AAF268_02190 [Cyanobacteria bacterium P01_A01_bin.3]
MTKPQIVRETQGTRRRGAGRGVAGRRVAGGRWRETGLERGG